MAPVAILLLASTVIPLCLANSGRMLQAVRKRSAIEKRDVELVPRSYKPVLYYIDGMLLSDLERYPADVCQQRTP